jgi:type IV pilus assembly protein PilP
VSTLKRSVIAAAGIALSLCLVACGDDPVHGGPAGSATVKPGSPPHAPPPPAAPTTAPTTGINAMPPLPKRDFQERDFAESDANRDPFRGFAADLAAQGKRTYLVQRKVLVERYALEELKLVGIVTGNPSRALLIDPTGFGWVAKVGDYVGRPEIVHSGGPTGADVPINWRVDRIRGGDVVLVREDPSHPEIPPATRVIALRAVEETVANRGAGVTSADKLP